jgi:hypothetical protein
MNIDLKPTDTPITVLKEVLHELTKIRWSQTQNPQIGVVEAVDMIENFTQAIQQLENQKPKSIFTNVDEVWSKMLKDAEKIKKPKNNLRLCKIEPNTDSFYFHEFVHDYKGLSLTGLNTKAPQHHNCFLPNSIGMVAVVEDKKGKIFITNAEYLKFIE